MSLDALTHVDAERTVLGCAMLDATALYRILPLLRAEDFSFDSHSRIYHVIAALAEAGKPVDAMTVTDALSEKGQLESVGGVAYLVNLDDQVTSSLASVTNVEHYAEKILDKSRRRQARAAGARLTNATEDQSVTTEECLQSVQESLLQIEAAFGRTTARHVRDFMPQVLRELELQSQNQGLVGMPTGIHSLNLATGGIRPGELWTIGALPGKGKTALAVQIVLANGALKTPTLAFSLEMQDLEIGKRFLAARSSSAAMQIRNPQTIRQDRWLELIESATEIAECPIYVDDRGSH